MDKYEISLWEDFPDTTENGVPFLNERKLCVIGSDTMMSQIRALEPKMITNVNGTHKFTFKMYYTYVDELTGETYPNPFGSLLINERKVKVLWKNEWYDLLIKKLEEDTSGRSITYTCEDLFITELSRNGYNIEFSKDLQNCTGTASELAAEVLDGSGWQFDSSNSTKIIQKTEEPVYEVTVLNSFNATKQSPNGDTSEMILSGKKILVFYSSILDITNNSENGVDIQFLYSPDGYATDENDMLVTNGNCYVAIFDTVKVSGYVNCKISNNTKFSVNTAAGVSDRYRAERLVNSQLTQYDELFNRYVGLFTDITSGKRVCGFTMTEFSDPLMIVNLVANPSQFTNLDGWVGAQDMTWGVYPKFTSSTDITSYIAKSYLKLAMGYTYNSAISSNKQYLIPSQGDVKKGNTGGFHIGDKYVFRVKVKANGADPSATSYLHTDIITPLITTYNNNYVPSGQNYFSVSSRVINGNWNEYTLTCTKGCVAEDIDNLGLFLNATAACWIEEVEFFEYAVGVTSYESNVEVRINPGEVALQSVAKTIYKYYPLDHGGAEWAEDIKFLYEGTEDSNRFVPVTNNYEKIATIEASQSNRFNILQDIAESFECWVRFVINHDETGRMTFDEEGLPEKYVSLVDYIGTDLGWSFEYGIDLKSIKRTIASNELSTKIIVLPNSNEFGKNGFCSIARSNLNYTKESFVLNLDYYITQGLLDQRTVDRDLYSSSSNYLGYYYYLHAYNKEYDEITEMLTQKRMELTKQESQLTVLEAQNKAQQEQLGNCQSDIMTLACVTTWSAAQAYARSHADHTKVQSLMNTIAQLKNTIAKNGNQLDNLRASINQLETFVSEKTARQKYITTQTENLHKRFFKKYARYIQEGTWQDESYVDDDKYYLDAVDVAYTSSRPQLQYEINVMRLSSLEDFSSKVFNVGDICYVVDREFFGYSKDGITPYKLKIIISEITSFFDSPEKDIIKVQNYKTQFDDLFQRITATTQSLQYSQGGYEKAAGVINPDRTLSFDLLQDTFDYNENWVLNASNQQVTWDSTGITVGDDRNAALKVRIIAGGIFVSNDGGQSWKNAIRGDGISTDILTAGRINTSEIYVYDGNHPSFRWDSAGIDAYYYDDLLDAPTFSKYVRFDRFGIYGYQGSTDFVPSTEDAIWATNSGVKFGLTWRGFFLRGSTSDASLEISDNGTGIVFKLTSGANVNKSGTNVPVSLEISTEKDIVLKTGNVDRIQIGRFIQNGVITDYGIWVRDEQGNNIFNVSATGTDSIGGWNLTRNSFYHTVANSGTLGLFSEGKTWTILGPTSTEADKTKVGNPQEGTGQASAGDTHSYYIIAGNKFGVTVDGEIYSAGGRIGGWYINESTLYSKNIKLDSDGNIICTVNGTDMWKIDNAGKGYFHNIEADGGKIAGWQIDDDKIWNVNTGTVLSATGDATYQQNKYTIVTNSIAASNGNIGGWSTTPSGFTSPGGGIAMNSAGNIVVSGDGYIQVGNIKLQNSTITISSNGSLVIGGITLNGYGGGGLAINGFTHFGNNVSIAGGLSAIEYLSVGGGGDSAGPMITAGGNGMSINTGLTVDGNLDTNGYITLGAANEQFDSDDAIAVHRWHRSSGGYDKEGYLDWLHTNWSNTTPQEVYNSLP